METTTQSVATYEYVGRLVAREHRRSAAAVIYCGLVAGLLRRLELTTGAAVASSDDIIEALCGDRLGNAAADELGLQSSLWHLNWIARGWDHITCRASEVQVPELATVEESAYRTVATQMALDVAVDHHVARSVLAGAAAVARLRRHSRSDVEGSTEDQIAEMAQTDPAVAAAGGELDEEGRRGPGDWVIKQWDEIAAAAEELAALTTAADTPPTVEQQVVIARHEVANWLRQTKLPACGTAYAAAAAEGRVRWLAAGGTDEDEDAVMAGFAAGDPAAAEAHTAFTPEARELIRRRVRELWG